MLSCLAVRGLRRGLNVPSAADATQPGLQAALEDREISHKESTMPRPRAGFLAADNSRARPLDHYRSISPITTSNEPTMAGTSAIKQPWHSAFVTDRLQKLLLRARARQGIASPLLTT